MIYASDLGTVSVFAKFNGGFQTQSSDDIDRKRSLEAYFVDAANRDWCLDIQSVNGNSTMYTFAMQGGVLTDSPQRNGRKEGVLGIQFEIDGAEAYSLGIFSTKFVALFRNACNDAKFFFRYAEPNYFPVGSDFPVEAASKTRAWLEKFLDALADDGSISTIFVPRVSQRRSLVLPATTDESRLNELFSDNGNIRIQALVPMPIVPLALQLTPTPPLPKPDADKPEVGQPARPSTAITEHATESKKTEKNRKLPKRYVDWLGFLAASALGAALVFGVGGYLVHKYVESSTKNLAILSGRIEAVAHDVRRVHDSIEAKISAARVSPTVNAEKKFDDSSSNNRLAGVEKKTGAIARPAVGEGGQGTIGVKAVKVGKKTEEDQRRQNEKVGGLLDSSISKKRAASVTTVPTGAPTSTDIGKQQPAPTPPPVSSVVPKTAPAATTSPAPAAETSGAP